MDIDPTVVMALFPHQVANKADLEALISVRNQRETLFVRILKGRRRTFIENRPWPPTWVRT